MIKNKREKIDVKTKDDFIKLLNEIYIENLKDEEAYTKFILKKFNLNQYEINHLNIVFNNEITYRAKNIYEFIDYIKLVKETKELNEKLHKKISHINMLYIIREEYERVNTDKEDVEDILKEIEIIKKNIVKDIDSSEERSLLEIELELDENYLYSKDIELLKKILINNGGKIEENYNDENNLRSTIFKIPEEIKSNYIIPKEGTLEYYYHLKTNIKRLIRLIQSIDKYIIEIDSKNRVFKINQSEVIQESANIAFATFNGESYKAVSGKINIIDYCDVVLEGDAVFESKKVNKLGHFGVGYNRSNDSEKKILERIDKDIIEGSIDKGNVILYTKLEPCLSCYYVISQFIKKHPNIKISVKFIRKYGEG